MENKIGIVGAGATSGTTVTKEDLIRGFEFLKMRRNTETGYLETKIPNTLPLFVEPESDFKKKIKEETIKKFNEQHHKESIVFKKNRDKRKKKPKKTHRK